MANVKVSWVLPTTRKSGKPLLVEQIAFAFVEMSADLGANFGPVGQFPPDVLETTVTELEPGEWVFRGSVQDTAGKVSGTVEARIVVEDTSPPSDLQLTLSLV